MGFEWERQEGILLQAIPYLGSHRILKVFTPGSGLLTIMAKHIQAKNAAVTTPFCRSEWVFRKSRTEFCPLKDTTLIDPMLHLREQYETLMAAGSIASDLLHSQFPERASKGLYELLSACLQHLLIHPRAIAQSFRLKLLQYEGLLRLQHQCMRCESPASHLSHGESHCVSHAQPDSLAFEPAEWDLLLLLGLSRHFSEFSQIQLSAAFLEKIARLFAERTNQ